MFSVIYKTENTVWLAFDRWIQINFHDDRKQKILASLPEIDWFAFDMFIGIRKGNPNVYL